jgi:hypothetical protein
MKSPRFRLCSLFVAGLWMVNACVPFTPAAAVIPQVSKMTGTPLPSNIQDVTVKSSPVPTETFQPTITPIAEYTQTILTPRPSTGAIHAMRVDYSDMTNSRSEVAAVEAHMKDVGVNMVTVGGGRPEWTYFKWPGHEANWASSVRDTGIDFLAEDATRFGKWARVDVTVDVLSPTYIRKHPDKAAINFVGVKSKYLVSTDELVNGEYGRQLLGMIEAIASGYPVDSISITELIYHSDGYGPDDLKLYQESTGRKGWPRNANGQINTDDVSIGDWRTHELDVFLDKAAVICHKYGKEFYLDVGLSLDNLNKMTNEHGTNYHVVLEHTDKLVLWAYYDLDHFPPALFEQVAALENKLGKDRFILSLGLWDEALPQTRPEKFSEYLTAAEKYGINDFWITPSTLMTEAHWQVLKKLWGQAFLAQTGVAP